MPTQKAKFVSAIFDFDGTLTPELGNHELDRNLAKKLVDLTYTRTFALCSGRPLGFSREVISTMCSLSENPELTRQNWFLVCENGALCYFFDSARNCWQKFSHADFPYSSGKLMELHDFLMRELAGVLDSTEINRHSLILRPLVHPGVSLGEWEERSDELAVRAQKVLDDFDPRNELAILNSGIGLLIINKKADKDHGTREFGRFLRECRGLDISENAREIAVIGDRPNIGGNDFAFLSGKFGVPFSVGSDNPQNPYLTTGPRQAAAGTLSLLEEIF